MAMNAQNPEEFPLYGLNLETGTWEQTGNNIAREMVNHPLLAAQKNTLYCLYTASDQTVLLKSCCSPLAQSRSRKLFRGHRSGWHMQSDRSGTLAAVSAEPEITDKAADGAC